MIKCLCWLLSRDRSLTVGPSNCYNSRMVKNLYSTPFISIDTFFFFGECGILVLWPGMELMQWKAQRLNHWITREASSLIPYCSSPSLPPSLFSFLLSFLLSSPSLPLSPPPLHFKGVASITHLWSTVFLKFSNYTLENTLGQRIWYQSAHFFGWSLAENSTYKNPSKMAFNYLENTKTTNFIETTFVLLRETRAN